MKACGAYSLGTINLKNLIKTGSYIVILHSSQTSLSSYDLKHQRPNWKLELNTDILCNNTCKIKRSTTSVLNSKTISERTNLASRPLQSNAPENLLKKQKQTHSHTRRGRDKNNNSENNIKETSTWQTDIRGSPKLDKLSKDHNFQQTR